MCHQRAGVRSGGTSPAPADVARQTGVAIVLLCRKPSAPAAWRAVGASEFAGRGRRRNIDTPHLPRVLFPRGAGERSPCTETRPTVDGFVCAAEGCAVKVESDPEWSGQRTGVTVHTGVDVPQQYRRTARAKSDGHPALTCRTIGREGPSPVQRRRSARAAWRRVSRSAAPPIATITALR